MRNVINKNSKKYILVICIISIVLSLGACASTQSAEIAKSEIIEAEESKDTLEIAKTEDLEVNDTAIVINIDEETKKIILQTISSDERYEIVYDGTSEFYDKYMQSLSAAQIEAGDIADVVVSVHSKLLKRFVLTDGFIKTGIDSYSINVNKGMFSIGEDNYKISEKIPVYLDDTIGKIADINEKDVLTVKGLGRSIYSIKIESGYGYLRLSGEEYFIGGWIECGKEIKPITERMLLFIPEGDYDLRVTYNGYGGTKAVHIDRNKETKIDVSDLKGELLKTGKVSISIVPNDADLYINGEKTDYNLPVELEYGVYQLDIKCDGYKSMRKYLSVGNESATVSFSMEESDGSDDEEELPDTLKSSSSEKKANIIPNIKKEESSSNNSERTPLKESSSSEKESTTSNKAEVGNDNNDDDEEKDIITTKANLYIDSPEGVEVYFDGSYKGIAPISFAKEKGTHVITLRKDGFLTKSYTLTLSEGDNDETYSFTMLNPE